MNESSCWARTSFVVHGVSMVVSAILVLLTMTIVWTTTDSASAEPPPEQQGAHSGSQLPTVYFVGTPFVHPESGGQTVPVALTHTIGQPVHVNYATSDGTATAGSDYTPTNGILTWLPGQAGVRTFGVPILPDWLEEPNETVILTLSAPFSCTIGAPNPTTLTIVDDDQTCIPRWDTEIGNSGMTGGLVRCFADTFTGATVGSDGAVLYAAGGPDQPVWKWDGASWAPLPGLPWGEVDALAVYDDGGGNALYAGGGFGQSGGPWYIARWYGDGTGWHPVELFDPDLPNFSGFIRALIPFNDGTGLKLYAGGKISIPGEETIYVARWDGTSWQHVQNGLNDGAWSFGVFDGDLYVGGTFTYVLGDPTHGYIARWNGSSWVPVGPGTDGTVHAMIGFNDGGGDGLYAGGEFTEAGGGSANYIAKWNGTSWSPLGAGVNGTVRALDVFDDSTGLSLYAGGQFTTAGGNPASRIAKWNGNQWLPLHGGVTGASERVYALASADDGGGPALFAGGHFYFAGGVPASHISKWRCVPFDECPLGDFDCDGSVDLSDYAAYNDCITGPEGELAPGCELFDFGADGDVDFHDFAEFQVLFTGTQP